MYKEIDWTLENEWVLLRNKKEYSKELSRVKNKAQVCWEVFGMDSEFLVYYAKYSGQIHELEKRLEFINSELRNITVYKARNDNIKLNVEEALKYPIETVLQNHNIQLEHGFCKCPFHQEKSASLKIYPSNSFYCFGCGVGGDVITLTEMLDSCDFQETVKKLL